MGIRRAATCAIHAGLRVGQRDLGIVIDLAPMAQQLVDLAVAAIGDQPPMGGDRFDRVRVAQVRFAVVEEDRVHLLDVTRIDQTGREAERAGDAENEPVVDAGRLDHSLNLRVRCSRRQPARRETLSRADWRGRASGR